MVSDVLIKSLHPLEIRVLLQYSEDAELSSEILVKELSYKVGQANQALSWLAAKDLVREDRRLTVVTYELTELGTEWATKGSPEERILAALETSGPRTLEALAGDLGVEQKELGSAFGNLSREKLVSMDAERRVSRTDAKGPGQRIAQVRSLLQKAQEQGGIPETDMDKDEKVLMSGISKKRGAGNTPFRLQEKELVWLQC